MMKSLWAFCHGAILLSFDTASRSEVEIWSPMFHQRLGRNTQRMRGDSFPEGRGPMDIFSVTLANGHVIGAVFLPKNNSSDSEFWQMAAFRKTLRRDPASSSRPIICRSKGCSTTEYT